MLMDEKNAWITFEHSGKISDYLLYRGYNSNEIQTTSEAATHADQNTRNRDKTPQYR